MANPYLRKHVGLAALVASAVLYGLPSFAEDAGVAPDAAVAVVVAAQPPADEPLDDVTALETVDGLRLRERRLRYAFDGDPRLDVSLATLFTADLADDDAVAARVEQLDNVIKRLTADTTVDLSRVPTSSTATTTVDATRLRRALVLKTSRLEHKFLSQDQPSRLARVRANAARDALALEHAEAEARQRRAGEESKRAQADQIRALEEAQAARTENLKRIKNQRAAVARAMNELAVKDRALGRLSEQNSDHNARAFRAAGRLGVRIQRTTSATASLALLDRVDGSLRLALDALDKAVQAYRTGFEPPELTLGERPDADNASEDDQAALEELSQAEEAYASYATKVGERESASLLLTISAWHKQALALDQGRNHVLQRLPQRSKNTVYALSQRGIGGARLELRSIATRTTARVLLIADDLVHVRTAVKDVFTLGRTFWALIKIALIIIGAFWIRSRGPSVDKWFEENLIARTRSVVWIHRLRFIHRFFNRFGRSLLFIATLHVAEWAIGAPDETTILDLVFTVVFWTSYYLLVRKLLRAGLIWALKRGPLPLGDDVGARVEASALLAGRTFFVTGLFLSLAAQILGPGVLYHGARSVLFLGVIVVGFIVLRQWREAIAASYLGRWPEGTIARLVESTSDKFYGVLVVLAAFVVVVARAGYSVVKRTALGFEHSRRALAFVFKMRLERRLDELGAWDARIEALPNSLVHAFRDDPDIDEDLLVDHFPGLDAFAAEFERWSAGKSKGSFLVHAPRGYGKTTWVSQAMRTVTTVEVTRIELSREAAALPAFLQTIAGAVDVEPSKDVGTLAASLNAGPRRVIVMEDLHQVILRSYDGYRALEALMALIEATGHHIFWLATVHEPTWHKVCAAQPRRMRFRYELELAPWTEEEIRKLVLSRAASASIEHLFEDVLVDATDTSAEAMNRAVEAYTRLIWDAADGSPRVSLHFWLRSLLPADETKVRVRLFREPDADGLEVLPDETKFIYSAIASHERLSSEEIATVLRLPTALAEAHLIRGQELGHLVRDPTGRYELDVYWARTIVRFLRRKRVL